MVVFVCARETGLSVGVLTLQSSLKISFLLGGDFAAETGVTGGDRNIPLVVDGGVEERKSDELDDDEGRL